MHSIPLYPEFKQLSMEMRADLVPVFESLTDGVSEFTFANLYLHREKYSYQLSRTESGLILVTGFGRETVFFFVLNGVPERKILMELFAQGRVWKLISPEQEKSRNLLAEWGVQITEDRNNSDYLYLRTDLAELKGKTFHKKKNLVNAFKNTFQYEIKTLDETTKDDALAVLEQWNVDRAGVTDYKPAKEALTLIDELNLSGWIVYVEGKPVGWSLGEKVGLSMYCVHFEKGLESIKGVYQFVNAITAQNLDESIVYINREQDLGDEGLRQAKMTYRPCGFVVKYSGIPAERA